MEKSRYRLFYKNAEGKDEYRDLDENFLKDNYDEIRKNLSKNGDFSLGRIDTPAIDSLEDDKEYGISANLGNGEVWQGKMKGSDIRRNESEFSKRFGQGGWTLDANIIPVEAETFKTYNKDNTLTSQTVSGFKDAYTPEKLSLLERISEQGEQRRAIDDGLAALVKKGTVKAAIDANNRGMWMPEDGTDPEQLWTAPEYETHFDIDQLSPEDRERYTELQAADKEFKDGYLTSDGFKAQLEYQRILNEESNLKAVSERKKYAPYKGDPYANLHPVEGMGGYTGGHNVIDAAMWLNNATKNTLNAPSRFEGTGVGNFAKGMSVENAVATLSDQFLKTGYFLGSVRPLLEKVAKLEDEKKDVAAGLTDEENLLLDAFMRNTQVNAMRAEEISLGYTAGKSALDSIPFMVSMAATSGILGGGLKSLEKGLMKYATKKMSKLMSKKAGQLLVKGAINTASFTAKTAGQTILDPFAIMRSTAENAVSYDENGDLMSVGESAGRALWDQVIEVGSENSGGLVNDVLALPFKGASKLLGKWSGKTYNNTEKFLSELSQTNIGRMMKQAGFHGIIGEWGEEWVGAAARTFTGLNPDELKNFATIDNQIVTLASFLPMTLVGGGANMTSVAVNNRQYDKRLETLQGVLGSNGFDAERTAMIVDAIQKNPQTAVSDVMGGLLSGVSGESWQQMSEEEKAKYSDLNAAVTNFALSSMWKNAVDGAYNYKQTEERAALLEQIRNEQFGGHDFFTGDEENGRNVTMVQTKDGTPYYALSEPQNGQIAVVAPSGKGIQYISEDSLMLGGDETVDAYLAGHTISLDDYLNRQMSVNEAMRDKAYGMRIRSSQMNWIQSRFLQQDGTYSGELRPDKYDLHTAVVIAPNQLDTSAGLLVTDMKDGQTVGEQRMMSWEDIYKLATNEDMISGETAEQYIKDRRERKARETVDKQLRSEDLVRIASRAKTGTAVTMNGRNYIVQRGTDGGVSLYDVLEKKIVPSSVQELYDNHALLGGADANTSEKTLTAAEEKSLYEDNLPAWADYKMRRGEGKDASERISAKIADFDAQIADLESQKGQDFDSDEMINVAIANIRELKSQVEAGAQRIADITAQQSLSDYGMFVDDLNAQLKDVPVPHRVVSDLSELETMAQTDTAAAKALDNLSRGIVEAWVSGGTAYFYAPGLYESGKRNAADASARARQVVAHELVAHVALRQMLGEERFTAFCNAVWAGMSEDARNSFVAYSWDNNFSDKQRGEFMRKAGVLSAAERWSNLSDIAKTALLKDKAVFDELARSAADEYTAHLAELVVSGRIKAEEDKILWQKIVDLLNDFLQKTFGISLNSNEIATAIVEAKQWMEEQRQSASEQNGAREETDAEAETAAVQMSESEKEFRKVLDFVNNGAITAEEGAQFVQNKVTELEKAVAKHQKSAPKMGTDLDKYLSDKKEYADKLESLNAELAYWRGVASPAEEEKTAEREVRLSDEIDENGKQFVLNSKGELSFGEIPAASGLTPAPILLSEGMITNPQTSDGYGLVHIEARHGEQIRNAGYQSVVEFIEDVAKNYQVIRQGKMRDGNQTYMLQLRDKHNNTLMVELSGDGAYWNINTAGIFKISYGKNSKEVYTRHTTDNQSTETDGASQNVEQSGTQTNSRMNAPTTSFDKGIESDGHMQEAEENSVNEKKADGGSGTELGKGAGADTRQSDLAQTETERIKDRLSDETDAFGHPFVISKEGSIDFGSIDSESGLTEAPIRLNLGENRIDEDGGNHGYGLIHIEAGHGEQIRKAGYNSVEEFVERVARTYTDIREGAVIASNQTYLLEVADEHNNTLFIQLSRDGKYWNVNSAGIFKKKYSRRKAIVHTVPALSSDSITEVEGVNRGQNEGETATSRNSPKTISGSKTTENISKAKRKTEKSADGEEKKALGKPEANRYVPNAYKESVAMNDAYRSGDAQAIKDSEMRMRKFLDGVDDENKLQATIDATKRAIKGQGKDDPVRKSNESKLKMLKERLKEVRNAGSSVQKMVGRDGDDWHASVSEAFASGDKSRIADAKRVIDQKIRARFEGEDGGQSAVIEEIALRRRRNDLIKGTPERARLEYTIYAIDKIKQEYGWKTQAQKNADAKESREEYELDRLEGKALAAAREYDAGSSVQKHAESSDLADGPTQSQREAAEIAVELIRQSGIEVSMDEKEMADVLGEGAQMQAKLNRLAKAAMAIRSWREKKSHKKSFVIDLPAYTKRLIKNVMGRDFDSHLITSDGIQHAINNHGVRGKHLNENSIPIREEDLELIPYIMTSPDYVKKGSTKNNRESVRFYKRLENGYVVVIEKEWDNSADDMETINMWAELSDVPNAKQTLSRTSETPTIGRSDAAKIRKDAEAAIARDGILQQLTVYHGSGADFEAFDHSHMGEGEGAQAYGWGTYVTEVNGIARTYAESSAKDVYKSPKLQDAEHELFNLRTRLRELPEEIGNFANQHNEASALLEREIKKAEQIKQEYGESSVEYRNWAFLGEDAIGDFKRDVERYQKLINERSEELEQLPQRIKEKEDAIKPLQAEYEEARKNRFLYTVDIPENTGENYLSWDKRVDGKMLDKISDAYYEYMEPVLDKRVVERVKDGKTSKADATILSMSKGEELYYQISRNVGSDEMASKFLKEIGVAGIEYPAEYQSGGRGDGKKNYVIFNEADAKIVDKTQFLRTRKGEVYGFVKDGKIYLDAKLLNPNTPVHEYTHIWDMALQKANPELWNRGVELMKQTALWDEVKKNPVYKDIAEDENLIASEVHSRLTGAEGAKLFERMVKDARSEKNPIEAAKRHAIIDRLRRWVSETWQWVKDTMSPWTKEEAGKVTLEEFVNMPLKDLVEGKRMAEYAESMDARTEFNRDLKDEAINDVNNRFNEELQQQIDGTLEEGHIYQLGMPNAYMLATGFPHTPIEMSATMLRKHSEDKFHPFKLSEVKNLIESMQHPLAIFKYGDETKSQNVIVEIEQNGKNFLVGIHFNQERRGLVVSDIRGIFPKNNWEWLHWIEQDKLKYVDKEKIQELIDKQRKTLAEVDYLDLDSVAKIVESFENPSIDSQDLTNGSDAAQMYEGAHEEARGQANEFAKEYGVSEESVMNYADAVKKKSLKKAAVALAEIEQQIVIANDFNFKSLGDFVKKKNAVLKPLYSRFGDIETLRAEDIRKAEERRGLMEAAKKKVEEEAAARQKHLDELSMLTEEEIDKRYADALENKDDNTAREMLDEIARRRGYSNDTEWKDAHTAPGNTGYDKGKRRQVIADGIDTPDVTLEDIAEGYNLQPADYFSNPRAYGYNDKAGLESHRALTTAMQKVTNGEPATVKVYRAVPTSIKEGSLRAGDWVTPSREYADMHGNHRFDGKYHVIEQEVPADQLWWDGNDIREWGFDDGKEYKYKNVKNNRKSDELVTRDNKGNIIPPSKRFNQRNNDIRFRFIGEKGAENADKAEEATTRIDNLNVARQMETDGKEAKNIKLATGWERGADGKWRYEVVDFKMNVDGMTKLRNMAESNLGQRNTFMMLRDLIGADDALFEEYPQLRDARVKLNAEHTVGISGSYGYDDMQGHVITLSHDAIDGYMRPALEQYGEADRGLMRAMQGRNPWTGEKIDDEFDREVVLNEAQAEMNEAERKLNDAKVRNDELTRSVLVHEIQHAIQRIEGFARGSNVDEGTRIGLERNELTQTQQNLIDDVAVYEEMAKNGYEGYSLREFLNSMLRDDPDRYGDVSDITTEDELMREVEHLRAMQTRKPLNGYEAYRNTAGEVEARNVQKRLDWTAEQRRNSLASETEDVADGDLIFLYDGLARNDMAVMPTARLDVDAEVSIVHAPAHSFANFKEAKDWTKENIVRTYSNEETGGKGEIMISNGAVTKYLSESAVAKSADKDTHLRVLRVLPDVIRESVDAEQHPDYLKRDGVRKPENGVNDNVMIHRLYGAVDIDGTPYRVKVTVKEHRDANQVNSPHSYEATKIELLAGTLGNDVQKNGTAPNTNNSITVAKLLKGAEKSYEKGKFLLDEINSDTESETSYTPFSVLRRTADVTDRTERLLETPLRTEDAASVLSPAALQKISVKKSVENGGIPTFDRDRADRFYMGVFRLADETMQRQMMDIAGDNGYDVPKTVSDQLASLAEKEVFGTISGAESDLLRNAANTLAPVLGVSTEQAKYILWQNANSEDEFENNVVRPAMQRAFGLDTSVSEGIADRAKEVRFSAAGRDNVDSALEYYDRAMRNGWNRVYESARDEFMAVEQLVEAIEKQTGKAAAPWENPMFYLNQESSRNMADMKEYMLRYMNPMWDAVGEMVKRTGRSKEDVIRYMMVLHGIERNNVFYMRDMNAWLKEKDEAAQAGLSFDKQMPQPHDYSGLTGLFKDEKPADYNELMKIAHQALSAYETVFGTADGKGTLANNLWEKVNAATKQNLNLRLASGLMSRETYDKISGMFRYYIPLQGFSEDTNEDIYTYYSTPRRSTGTAQKAAKGRTSVGDGSGNYVKIPIPQELRPFYTVGDMIAARMARRGRRSERKGARSMPRSSEVWC